MVVVDRSDSLNDVNYISTFTTLGRRADDSKVPHDCYDILWYNRAMKDLSELLELPADQRLQLVEAIWDSLVEIPETVPISEEVREELDRRLAAYYDNPSSARPWREIRDDLLGTK